MNYRKILKSLSEIESRIQELEGQKKYFEQKMKEAGFNSVEELKEGLKKEEKLLDKLERKIKGMLEELNEKYNIQI